LGLWDEKGFPVPLAVDGAREASSYNTVINNVAFSFVADAKRMGNCLIANNTFDNLFMWTVNGAAGLKIINNICGIGNFSGTFTEDTIISNNSFLELPSAILRSATDVIGDPKFTKTGNANEPSYYTLDDGSPCMGSGVALAEVVENYFKTARAEPYSIGAI
jgi:hypothetical protein